MSIGDWTPAIFALQTSTMVRALVLPRAIRSFFERRAGEVRPHVDPARCFGLAKTTPREHWDHRVPLRVFEQANLQAASLRALVRSCGQALANTAGRQQLHGAIDQS
jgi:hypothetical protein